MSDNSELSLEEFTRLLAKAVDILNEKAKTNTAYFLERGAQRLEKDVLDALKEAAKDVGFDGPIKLFSGLKFPDIVVAGHYGVEVKSSKNENWTTLGGSVNESTRIEDVEKVFLVFGKLVSPITFISRPYEDCLSEVVATHYPRYRIDMKLGDKETIFDKMQVTYDELRESDNAVGRVVKYYKSQLKEGESLWWIDSGDAEDESDAASMKVRLWSSLAKAEKTKLQTTLFALFPDILSTENNTKYSRAVLWLVSCYGIVHSSLRDDFSAGGKVSIITTSGNFRNLPRVYKHLKNFSDEIQERIEATPINILCETWQVEKVESNRIAQWINLASEKRQVGEYEVVEVLKAIFEVN
jgi:hypothetical protein